MMMRVFIKDILQFWRQAILVFGICILYTGIEPRSSATTFAAGLVVLGSYVLTLRSAFEEERSGTLPFLTSLPITRRWIVSTKFVESIAFSVTTVLLVGLTFWAIHGVGHVTASSYVFLRLMIGAWFSSVVLGGFTLLLFFAWGYRVAASSLWVFSALALALRFFYRYMPISSIGGGMVRWLLQAPMSFVALALVCIGVLFVFWEYAAAAMLFARRDLT